MPYIQLRTYIGYKEESYGKSRQHIQKQRHYFADQGSSSQSYGFSSSHVWIWVSDHKESWAQRTDAFELWYWWRLFRVPWTASRSNQSILKEINPEHSLEGLMLKLKLQYFSHLMQRANSFENTLMLGKIESMRRRGEMVGWDHRLNGHEFEQALGGGEGQGRLACCIPWSRKESDTTEWLNNNKNL